MENTIGVLFNTLIKIKDMKYYDKEINDLLNLETTPENFEKFTSVASQKLIELEKERNK